MIAAVSVFLSAPVAGASGSAEYAGSDAGCVVYSVGTIKIGMRFALPYRRVQTDRGLVVEDWKGQISPRVGGAWVLKVKDPDFAGEETGHVVVRCLPPGEYQIGNFEFHGFLPGVGSYEWSSANNTSFVFHIGAGQATYIGSFMRAPSLGTSLQPVLGAAGFFVVADRGARDLPIAKSRLRAGMRVSSEVTDVAQFRNPALRTSEP